MTATIPKDRLFISFSGGRTSAFMTKRLIDAYRGARDVVVIFANTGREDERTLQFVKACDDHFDFRTVWVEAVVWPAKGVGTTHRVVSFETADRNGGPFERAIEKYGIPNKNFPHCTRELKQRPMYSYLRSIGWMPGTYSVAIGIRADEMDRISVSAQEEGIFYPLVEQDVKKPEIIEWFKHQPFDLYTPEQLGNCTTCYKKSLRKLLTVAKQNPEQMEFTRRMEEQHGYSGPGETHRPRVFFRERRSTLDLIRLSNEAFEPFVDDNAAFDPNLDVGGGCEESCEVFTAEFMSDLTTYEDQR